MRLRVKKNWLLAIAGIFIGIIGLSTKLQAAELIRQLKLTGIENIQITPKPGASITIISSQGSGSLDEFKNSTMTASGLAQNHSMKGDILDLVKFSDPSVKVSSTSTLSINVTGFADELTRWFVYTPGGPAMLYSGKREVWVTQIFGNGQQRKLKVMGIVAYSAFGTSTLEFTLPSDLNRPVEVRYKITFTTQAII